VPSEFVYYIYERIFPAAFALLPAGWDSREARAELLAIGYQESEFNARIQGGKGTKAGKGPAHGLWQFEKMGGVWEALSSPITGPVLQPICRQLLYVPTPAVVHEAIVHNDVLAMCLARCLLRIDFRALPTPLEWQKGWSIYKNNWRPGEPHPEKWARNFSIGWKIVKGE
jgi:hypothetical protein